jgi:hypothetical protein
MPWSHITSRAFPLFPLLKLNKNRLKRIFENETPPKLV